MKKFVNILSLLTALVSGIVVICTFLTTYQFYYVAQIFNTYFAVQISLSITMAVWAYRFWAYEHGKKRIIYSSISLSLSVVLLYLTQYIK